MLEWDGEGKAPVPLLKEMFAVERRKAKVLNFSIAYGKTAHGLSKDWKVSLEEAQNTVDRWYGDRPEVGFRPQAVKDLCLYTQRGALLSYHADLASTSLAVCLAACLLETCDIVCWLCACWRVATWTAGCVTAGDLESRLLAAKAAKLPDGAFANMCIPQAATAAACDAAQQYG